MKSMPVTVVLREGATGEPEWTLSVRGRAEQARVELRTSRARMVIAPETLEPDVLSQVLGTADELEVIQRRLRRLANGVPEPPEEMLDHEVPYDLHAELLTTLECVAEDDLGGAIGKLRTAAATTPEDLRRFWEDSYGGDSRDGWGWGSPGGRSGGFDDPDGTSIPGEPNRGSGPSAPDDRSEPAPVEDGED